MSRRWRPLIFGAAALMIALISRSETQGHDFLKAHTFYGAAADLIDQSSLLGCGGEIYSAASSWDTYVASDFYFWLYYPGCRSLSGQPHGFAMFVDALYPSQPQTWAITHLYGVRLSGSWGECFNDYPRICPVADSARIEVNKSNPTMATDFYRRVLMAQHELGHVITLDDIYQDSCRSPLFTVMIGYAECQVWPEMYYPKDHDINDVGIKY